MGGKSKVTPVLTEEQVMRHLLESIDGLDVLAGSVKAAKLSDAEGEIRNLELNLVGMRRALVQYKKPNAQVDASGQTLGMAITDAVKQLERLRAYKEEIQALPDDQLENDDSDEEEGDSDE